jgi:hypothetical protein
MDPSHGPVHLLLYIIGIALAECIIFSLVHGLVVLRQRGIARIHPAPSIADTAKSIASASDDESAWDDVDIRGEKGAAAV